MCVVLASEGYPGTPRTGDRIDGLEEAAAIEGVNVFHAGTALDDELKQAIKSAIAAQAHAAAPRKNGRKP